MGASLRLGFACRWAEDPASTWSYTPWNLRRRLREKADVVDVGVNLSVPVRNALKAAFARRHDGRWVTTWIQSGVNDLICERVIQRNARRTGCDAVLEMQDLAAPDIPFFVYQDLTFDILLRSAAADGTVPHFPAMTRDALLRRRDRQYRVYERAAGVLMMSRWAASTVVDWSGLPAAKVHVVLPGRTVAAGETVEMRVDRQPRRRLLLVGKDFHTKGGDVVVDALAILRREHDPQITLTVAGPATWPLPGPVPPGVSFRGRLPVGEVAGLYTTHDLLVMPSRLEGFGIVFVEALAHGMPCVGRRAFAMPELITPGRNGDLVDGDDPEELARTVATVLADDDLYASCAAGAPAVAGRFNWERSAEDALGAITRTLGR